MFTARPDTGFDHRLPSCIGPVGATSGRAFRAGGMMRMAALLGLLGLGLPGTSSAQAIGTMQVAARVVPASVAWTGLAEAGAVARSAAARRPGGLIRRRGLVHTTAEILPSGGRPRGRGLLIVTIQHPLN